MRTPLLPLLPLFLLLAVPAVAQYQIVGHVSSVTIEKDAECEFSQVDEIKFLFESSLGRLSWSTPYIVSDFDVSADGTALTGAPDRTESEGTTVFTWTFDPLSAGDTANFTLSYTLAGEYGDGQKVIDEDSGDDLNKFKWNVVSKVWPVEVRGIAVTVALVGATDATEVTSAPAGTVTGAADRVTVDIFVGSTPPLAGLEVQVSAPTLVVCGGLPAGVFVAVVVVACCVGCGAVGAVVYSCSRVPGEGRGGGTDDRGFDDVGMSPVRSEMDTSGGTSAGSASGPVLGPGGRVSGGSSSHMQPGGVQPGGVQPGGNGQLGSTGGAVQPGLHMSQQQPMMMSQQGNMGMMMSASGGSSPGGVHPTMMSQQNLGSTGGQMSYQNMNISVATVEDPDAKNEELHAVMADLNL